jgi:hypothetical protein
MLLQRVYTRRHQHQTSPSGQIKKAASRLPFCIIKPIELSFTSRTQFAAMGVGDPSCFLLGTGLTFFSK